MAIKRRGKTLSLYKRVPKRYSSIEPRKFVWLALHTDSETVAQSKAGPAWDALIEGWEAKLAGDTSDAEQRFAAARELAAVRGFRYMRADQVAKLPTDELLERVAAVGGTDDAPDVRDAEAVLGAAQEPEITVSKRAGTILDTDRRSGARQERRSTAPLEEPEDQGDQEPGRGDRRQGAGGYHR